MPRRGAVPTWSNMRVLACLVLVACASNPVTPTPPVPSPVDPICAALEDVVPHARDRFSKLLASTDPLYATRSQATDDTFANGGPATVGVPGGTAAVLFDWGVGDWTVTFVDASDASFRRVSDAVERCAVIAGWTREPARANEAIWFRDVRYEIGPPRRLRLRVNRMLASDPLALEPRADALWLTLGVSPFTDR